MNALKMCIFFTLIFPFSGFAASTANVDLPFHFLGTIGEKHSSAEMANDQNKPNEKETPLELTIDRNGNKLEGEYTHSGQYPNLGFINELTGEVDAKGQFKLELKDPKLDYQKLQGKWEGKKISGTWSNALGSYPFSLIELEKPESAWLEDLAKSYRGTIGKKINVVFKIKKSADAQNLTGIYKYLSSPGILTWAGRITSKLGEIEFIEKDDSGKITGTWRGKILERGASKRIIGIWTNPKTGKSLPFDLSETNGDPFEYLDHTVGLKIISVSKNISKKNCNIEYEYAQIVDWADKQAQTKLNNFLKAQGFIEDDCAEFADNARSQDTIQSATIRFFLSNRYVITNSSFWDSGGVHANTGSRCYVFDLKSGSPILLSKYYKQNIREKLNLEIKKALDKVADVELSEDAGLLKKPNSKFHDEEICPNGHGLVFLDHEVPYVVAQGELEIAIDAKSWRNFFEVNEVTSGVFGQ